MVQYHPPHIPPGMLTPTSGDAFIGGYSINVAMSKIRQNLGICPQFDILWPDITVREHLQLYAAIKGCDGGSARGVAEQAAASVGMWMLWLGVVLCVGGGGCMGGVLWRRVYWWLVNTCVVLNWCVSWSNTYAVHRTCVVHHAPDTNIMLNKHLMLTQCFVTHHVDQWFITGLTDKLDSLAGELSGGQRRKLSVGIAFMGNPAVVFLGMCVHVHVCVCVIPLNVLCHS